MMEYRQSKILLISDNEDRAERLTAYLHDPKNKIFNRRFDNHLANYLLREPFDLLILDCDSRPDFDYQDFDSLRSHQKIDGTPIIFILNPQQERLRKQIYRNPKNLIFSTPPEKFAFISMVNSALFINRSQRRLKVYKDILDGEKKLISNLDELLEFDRISQIKNEKELFDYLERIFVQRLELTLAVENAFFARYEKQPEHLLIRLNNEKNTSLANRRQTFSIKDSKIQSLLSQNTAHIFEPSEIGDPFILELEETLGYKIHSLLFIPVAVFHRPIAAIILINKIYRDELIENDLTFSLLAVDKITYHLEAIYLEKLRSGQFSALDYLLGKDKNLYQEWNLYYHIVNSVNFGIVVFNDEYKVHFYNTVALRLLNVPASVTRIQHLKDIFRNDLYEQLNEVLEGGHFPVLRKEIQIRKSGRPDTFIGYSIYPYREANNEKGYIIIFSEISQSKRLQAEIVRMDRMASLGILSSGIAHEIRNPLAGIKAMAQNLDEELGEKGPQVEYIRRILRQVDRLDHLLRAFFSYAKPVRPEPKTSHIKKIVHEVLPLVQQKMRQKGIRLDESYAGDLYQVFVDANQIEQVFLNLFLNAVDAMPEGGAITIRANNSNQRSPIMNDQSDSTGLLSDRFVEIHFSDTGKGISKDDYYKVFDPFFTTKSNGTGLGLSIVYQIIREHSGHIDLESEENKGTTFTILLPASEENTELVQ